CWKAFKHFVQLAEQNTDILSSQIRQQSRWRLCSTTSLLEADISFQLCDFGFQALLMALPSLILSLAMNSIVHFK
ncbi:MAG: hypothetical protein ACRDF4_08290, partial [Rhabdochlamydiaceae bacterium]